MAVESALRRARRLTPRREPGPTPETERVEPACVLLIPPQGGGRGKALLISRGFTFAVPPDGQALGKAIGAAARGDGAALGILISWAGLCGGVRPSLRFAHRKAGARAAHSLSALLKLYAEEIAADVAERRERARAEARQRKRSRLPLHVGEVVVDAPPALPERLALPPAPEEGRNSVTETTNAAAPAPEVGPGPGDAWQSPIEHGVRRRVGPRPEGNGDDDLLHPSNGCPRPW